MSKKIQIIIGVAVLLLVIVGVVSFAVMSSQKNSNNQSF